MLFNMLMVAGMACADVPALDAEHESLDMVQIESIAAADPECWQATYHLGRAGMVNGNLDEGIERFIAVVERVPGNSHVHMMLGRAYLSRAGAESSLGDAGDGVEHLELAIELDPENLDARSTLAAFHRSAP